MKVYLSKLFVLLSFILSLNSCSSHAPGQNKVIGTTVGAAAGTGLGAASGPSPGPITLVGTGAIVGALIGSSFGNAMENSDKEKAYQAIAAGKPATWENPNSKVSYTIVPATQYTTFGSNTYCRRFTATQKTADSSRKINRIACKEKDEHWQLVN